MIFMFCRQYSHAVTQVFMAYWNNAECLHTKDKQWQNVGGGTGQDHATEVTRVRRLSDMQHFNCYLSIFIRHKHTTATSGYL